MACVGGRAFMNLPPPSSRQPVCEVWSRECLLHERNIALGSVLEPSSLSSYTSAVQSYMTFCRTHDFPVDPTTDTLSFYVVYICHFIKPKSVSSYLSGICNQLEVFYPDVRQNCTHPIVKRTLQGCKKIHISIASRKRPLQHTELTKVFDKLHSSLSFDDQLFLVLFFSLSCDWESWFSPIRMSFKISERLSCSCLSLQMTIISSSIC